MGIFSGVSNATKGGKTPYFQPDAQYLNKVVEVAHYESKNPQAAGTEFFRITVDVLETNASPTKNVDAQNPQAVQPGQRATHLITLRPWNGNGENPNMLQLGDIKAFIEVGFKQLAIDGEDGLPPLPTTDEGWGELVGFITGDKQPLSGLKLGLTTNGMTTKKGKPFTLHDWCVSDGFEVLER